MIIPHTLKKEIFFILIQFSLFSLYFIGIDISHLDLPIWTRPILTTVSILGIVIIIFGIINLNENLTFSKTRKRRHRLPFRGIYNYVRHPIYAGVLITMIGYGFLSASMPRIIITIILAFVFYKKTGLEEAWLVQKFEAYKFYQKNTGRFFPRLHRKS